MHARTLGRSVWLAAGIAVIAVASVSAQGPRWDNLGSRTVNHSADRDEIRVTAREGRYSSIKLTVERRGVEFKNMIVHFGDPRGGTQDVAIRKLIESGGETRVINLTGGSRVIARVVFLYTSAGRGGGQRPVVTLWGR